MNFVDKRLYLKPRYVELLSNFGRAETVVGKIYYSCALSNDAKITELMELVEHSNEPSYLTEIFKNGDPQINGAFIRKYEREFHRWLTKIGPVGIFRLDWVCEDYKLFALMHQNSIQAYEYKIIWRQLLTTLEYPKIAKWLIQSRKIKCNAAFLFERPRFVPLTFVQLFLDTNLIKRASVLEWAEANKYKRIKRFVTTNYI